MATIEDVAKAAGVSKGTVSNVFSKKRPASKEVTKRVIEIANQLNYKPNYWARTLAIKETRIIGLKMPGENSKFSQFHLALLNGVLHVCYENGYRLLVNTLSPEFQNQIQNVSSDPVDGEIYLDPEQNDGRLDHRTQSDPPAVVIGRPPRGLESSLCYVDNDNEATAEQVTSYLLELGHRNILFLNTSKARTVSEDRKRGYDKAFINKELEVQQELSLFKQIDISSLLYGYQSIKEMDSKRVPFSAVITDSDKVALGVYRAAIDLGLSIPNDISVVAFSDESIVAPEFAPPLSSVYLNAEELGREAARILLERIQDNRVPVTHHIIQSKLVIRESCRRWQPHD
ncbi:MAG: LacI family transcriptional regulator [Bacilli bacterium]|nr:LacI family transcriptional regulator [Bacilli bacterium]